MAHNWVEASEQYFDSEYLFLNLPSQMGLFGIVVTVSDINPGSPSSNTVITNSSKNQHKIIKTLNFWGLK